MSNLIGADHRERREAARVVYDTLLVPAPLQPIEIVSIVLPSAVENSANVAGIRRHGRFGAAVIEDTRPAFPTGAR
jgi:hypothetical protein